MKTVVVSFYMDNMPLEMVSAQADVVSRFLPRDWAFHQINTAYSHAQSIDNFLAATRYKTVVLLDVDCIPLHRAAFDLLVDNVSSTQIVGCAQRANHIENGGHLYAGPFCCAFDRDLFEAIGAPSFAATARGDCGEELTYACEKYGKAVKLWWPSAVEAPRWKLTDEISFGLGTEYEGRFWHMFEARFESNRARFPRDATIRSKLIFTVRGADRPYLRRCRSASRRALEDNLPLGAPRSAYQLLGHCGVWVDSEELGYAVNRGACCAATNGSYGRSAALRPDHLIGFYVYSVLITLLVGWLVSCIAVFWAFRRAIARHRN